MEKNFCFKCGADLREQERKGAPTFEIDSPFRYEDEQPVLCVGCFNSWLEEQENALTQWLSGKTSKYTCSQEYKEGYVYLLKCDDVFKIGFSKDVERRIKQLDTRPFSLEFIAKYYSDIAYDIEHKFHKDYQVNRLTGEWYIFDFDIISNFEKIISDIEKSIKGEE